MPATQLRLGPGDNGRELTLEEFEPSDFEEGHRYELIDGRLEVSPAANTPEGFLHGWLRDCLLAYLFAPGTPRMHMPPASRVFVPGRPQATAPEPDIALYRGVRRELIDLGHWRNLSPLIVAEVLVESDPRKDLERNVELYLAVPTIREYWVLDGRRDVRRPELIRHRRRGARWIVRTLPAGSTYSTPLLPGFALLLDPTAEAP